MGRRVQRTKQPQTRRWVLRVTVRGGETTRYGYVALDSGEAMDQARDKHPDWVGIEWLPRGVLAAVWCCARCDYTFARMERPTPKCPNCEGRDQVYIQWGNIAVTERHGEPQAVEEASRHPGGDVGF